MTNTDFQFQHKPVLLQETISSLDLKQDEFAIDGTAGGGGHLSEICKAVGQNGKIFAFDRDIRAHQSDAAGKMRSEYKNLEFFHDNYSTISKILDSRNLNNQVDAILCDIGTSSHHFDNPERGFSFQEDGPLDMRMDQSQGQTAYELLKNLREDELADLIYKYGDERLSRKIAKFIKTSWPIKNSTKDLAALVCRAYPKKRHKIHPATRTFQALRVAVNNELEELETLLNSITKILAPGGRIAIISFQSHEDRLVKHFFRNLVKEDTGYKLINKRPIIASPEELAANPRARSAKLRVLQRIL